MAAAPILQEAEPLGRDLGALGEVGLDALAKLGSGAPAPERWRDETLALLREVAAPRAQLEFPPLLLGALRELVVAASERGKAADVPPADWARAVREQAAAAAPKRPPQ